MADIFPAIEATPKRDLAPAGTLSNIHHVYEDQFRPGKWTTKLPTKLEPPVEDEESAQHALVVRYKMSEKPDRNFDLHSVVVQSPSLKKVLARVFGDYPGITVELERLEFNAPFECFVHRWERLIALREEVLQHEAENVGNQQAVQAAEHLELLYSVLTQELGPVLREKQDLVKHGVMRYKQLWTIFEPGCLIYHKHNDHHRVYKLKSAKFDSNNFGEIYKLECLYVDYDGERFGWNKTTLHVNIFRGTKRIDKFESYPLIFHEKADEMRQTLIERGRKFEAYKGYQFVGYEGIAWGKAHRGEAKYNVNSRVIIDAHAYARYKSKVSLEHFETSGESEETLHNPEAPKEDNEDYMMVDNQAANAQAADHGKQPQINNQKSSLSEEKLLLADASVRGYSLRDKNWFSFFIDNMKDIEWNEHAFESLVAPPEQKDLILAFAESQIQHRENFDDIIQGKGKGTIMLLSGPPGVGKTLTCEAVAETMKVPLYSVGAAELGSKPSALEKSLADILEMCAKWNAVLLLDEADVFMEARSTAGSTADLDRNKLISIFLRLLEYFEGIMFLTTNRAENLDAAFESRIHLALQYHELDKASRRQIWSNLLHHSSETANSNVGPFTDAELDKLAKVVLNGRQIKNSIKTAQLLASKYDEVLGMGHLDLVLKLRRQNEKRTMSFLGGGE